MKFCKDCNESVSQVLNTPAGLESVLFCKNENCREPVMGEILPCEVARKSSALCTMTAKFFVKKKDPPQENNIVQLS